MKDFKKLSDKDKVIFAAEKINDGVKNVHEHVTSKIELGSYLPSSLIVVGLLALIGAVNHPGLVLLGAIILAANAITQNKDRLFAEESKPAASETATTGPVEAAAKQPENSVSLDVAATEKPRRVRKAKTVSATPAEISEIESKKE